MAEPIIVVRENSMTIEVNFQGDQPGDPVVESNPGGTHFRIRWSDYDYSHDHWFVHNEAAQSVFFSIPTVQPFGVTAD